MIFRYIFHGYTVFFFSFFCFWYCCCCCFVKNIYLIHIGLYGSTLTPPISGNKITFFGPIFIIRASCETKKERLSYRKKCIEEFVRGKSLFWFTLSFFVALFVYPLPKWRTCWVVPIKIYSIAMGGILCHGIMSERSKIWKSLAV